MPVLHNISVISANIVSFLMLGIFLLCNTCSNQGWAQGSFVEAERSRQRRGKAAMSLTEARQGRCRGRELEAEARKSEIDVVCVVLISCTMHM